VAVVVFPVPPFRFMTVMVVGTGRDRT
jgi:hypothetical protein